jgi:hypothetical protein
VAARDPGLGEMFMRRSGGGHYSQRYYSNPGGNYQGGSNGRPFFQDGFFGGLSAPAPSQAQRSVNPPYVPPNSGSLGEMRPRYSEDLRWAPPPRGYPDVSWREHQRGYW